MWLEHFPKNSEGAEIGVWKGDFTRLIYRVVNPRRLHLIDPWRFQPEFPQRMYGGKVAKSQADMDAIHTQVEREFGARNAVFHRRDSSAALVDIPDQSLDWVYIDGNHYYEYVRADLEGYFEKLVPGGLLTGDDYSWRFRGECPVRRAVEEFCRSDRVEWVDSNPRRYILKKR